MPESIATAAVTVLLADDDPDFGWVIHAPSVGNHLLVVCDVSECWQVMPSQAVRSAVAQRITRWAAALSPSLGVASWGRGDQPEVLIVAADQATAEIEAKVAASYLADLNPPPPALPAPPECGCPEYGWHLITCVHDGQPLRDEERAA